jgi:energy-coupling factor transporter ATP-binding protein EcfA2
MLKRIVIQNYRSCLRTSIEFHPDLSVLIGPNSSGKTNILQAVMLLNKLTDEDPFRPSQRPVIAVTSRIRAAFESRADRIQLNASIDAYTDESNNDNILGSRQKWTLKGRGGQQVLIEIPLALIWRSTPHFAERQFLLPFPGLRRYRVMRLPEGVPARAVRVLGRVANYCAGIRYYGASQFTNPGSCPVSFEVEQEGKRQWLSRLRGHARILYNMYSAQKSDPNHRYDQFMDIVGPRGLRLIDALTFREVRTSSIDYSVRVGGRVEVRRRHKLLVIPQFRLGKQRLSPNQLSEGTFKTLALLFHIITGNSTTLLIEEPEVCVHHGLLSSILELVKSYSRNKQMIISTHSDYVLDHVSPENVYRVTFDKTSGTSARHVPKVMTPREYSALREYLEQEGNLGEYWREGGLGDRT